MTGTEKQWEARWCSTLQVVVSTLGSVLSEMGSHYRLFEQKDDLVSLLFFTNRINIDEHKGALYNKLFQILDTQLSHLIFHNSLKKVMLITHFINKANESQRVQVTCLKSYVQKVADTAHIFRKWPRQCLNSSSQTLQ